LKSVQKDSDQRKPVVRKRSVGLQRAKENLTLDHDEVDRATKDRSRVVPVRP